MKENIFVDVSDGTCNENLQILVLNSKRPHNLTTGSSITASGFLKISPNGQLELNAVNIEVCGKCVVTDGYPFAPRKSYPSDYVRQYLHLRPRTNKFASLLRIRDAAMLAIHNHLHDEGFINIHTPMLTSNDCEGAGEVFKVVPENEQLLNSMVKEDLSQDQAYFDSKVFLTVSGQLHLEAVAHGISKVYAFGPTFRAENSRSRLHLSEFYMLEGEIAFVDRIEHLTDYIEILMKDITNRIYNKCAEDIQRCRGLNKLDLSWVHKKFCILSYDEAVSILHKNKGRYKGDFNINEGLSKEHEIFLVNFCDNIPTFIINWPKQLKPFYMRESADDNTKVAALDLLTPGVGEVVGGSLRENDYNKLKQKLPANSDLDWYLDLRKYGSVPTAGYGLGFERYLQLIIGISNIKDTIPFPRWPHNCKL